MLPIIRALLATMSRRLIAQRALVVQIVVLEGVRRMRLVVVVRMLVEMMLVGMRMLVVIALRVLRVLRIIVVTK